MILLDTHILIWWVEGSRRLSPGITQAIERTQLVLVSPMSMWELATLVEKGRVSVDRDLLQWSRDLFASETVKPAPLTATAAIEAAQLPGFHGDAADRIIYATARDIRAPLATQDAKLRAYALERSDIEVVF